MRQGLLAVLAHEVQSDPGYFLPAAGAIRPSCSATARARGRTPRLDDRRRSPARPRRAREGWAVLSVLASGTRQV